MSASNIQSIRAFLTLRPLLARCSQSSAINVLATRSLQDNAVHSIATCVLYDRENYERVNGIERTLARLRRSCSFEQAFVEKARMPQPSPTSELKSDKCRSLSIYLLLTNQVRVTSSETTKETGYNSGGVPRRLYLMLIEGEYEVGLKSYWEYSQSLPQQLYSGVHVHTEATAIYSRVRRIRLLKSRIS